MDNRRIVATGLRFPEGPVACSDGSVFVVEIERKTVSRVTQDGRIEVVAELGGGPNGLGVGPDGMLYVCNNGGFLFFQEGELTRMKPGVPEGYAGGFIQRLDPDTGKAEVLYDRCGDHHLVGPNDLVFDDQGGFYFTDFGKLYPRYRMNGGLYYAKSDGSYITEVAYPMITPNGVALSPDGKTVYVAETETGRAWAFDIVEPGKVAKRPFPSPHGGRLVIDMGNYHRFDSMAVDAAGNLCIATIVGNCISVVSPAGELLRQVPIGDFFTTNIAFGGPDMKTAYVTMSGTGQLMALDWPEPGYRLPNSDLR